MLWLGLSLLILIFCFGFVLLFGAPYLPTLTKHMQEALDMIDLQPGQTLLELGSGDGKVLKAAAQRGWRAVGYELNPLLVIFSRLRLWRYRRLVQVRWANFWRAAWPPADGIFIFIMPRHMTKLDQKVAEANQRGMKLVSFAFEIPNRKAVKQTKGVYLYEYPVKTAA